MLPTKRNRLSRFLDVIKDATSDMPRWSKFLEERTSTELWMRRVQEKREIESQTTLTSEHRPIFQAVSIIFTVLDFIDYLLRGMGQVVFCNNSISGLLITFGLIIQSRFVASGALVGLAANTLTAIFLGIPKPLIRAGLYGYNGVLVGAGMATFISPEWKYTTFLAIIGVSVVATLIHVAMVNFLSPYKLPVLTMPFNLSTIIFLYGCLNYNHFDVSFQGKFPDPTIVNPIEFNFLEIVKTSFRGVGQVYLCDNWIAGLLILLGIFVSSRISGIFGWIGSVSGILYAYAVGASTAEVTAGLWGYNPVLACMAIGGFFFVINIRTAVMAFLCALTSCYLFGMFKIFFSVWGIPSCTLGFCTAAFIFLFQRTSVPFMHPMDLGDITTPEGNYRWWRDHHPSSPSSGGKVHKLKVTSGTSTNSFSGNSNSSGGSNHSASDNQVTSLDSGRRPNSSGNDIEEIEME